MRKNVHISICTSTKMRKISSAFEEVNIGKANLPKSISTGSEMRKTGWWGCEEVIGKVQVQIVANICGHSGLSLLVGVVLCAIVWENGSMVNYCECCEQTRTDESRAKVRQGQTRADKNRQESRAKVRHSEVSWLVYSVSTQGKSSTWCEEAGVDQTTIVLEQLQEWSTGTERTQE